MSVIPKGKDSHRLYFTENVQDLRLVELGESLPHDYVSDNANGLASQKQHPGMHSEFSGAASLIPEHCRKREKQRDSSKGLSV